MDQKTKPSLIRELLVIWSVGWLIIISFYTVLGLNWEWTQSHQWLVQTGLIWFLVLHLSFKRIDLNRPDLVTPLYARLGWANRLTLLRGGFIAMTGGFIFLFAPPGILAFAPGIIYTLAAMIDRLDGYVARKTRQQSLLGSELDTVFDALGLVLAPVLAVWYGQIHWTYLLVGIAYYLFRLGIYYRTRQGLVVNELKPNISRRAIAGYQMGFIAVVLWPVYQPPVTTIAGVAFMLPLLIGFSMDWLVVSGSIDPCAPKTTLLFDKLKFISKSFFKPLLRIIVFVLIYFTLVQTENAFIPVRQSDVTSDIILFGSMIAGILVLFGIAGRLAALLLVLLLGWHYLSSPVEICDALLIFSIIWVMSLGTGRYSLWQGDEEWVNRYDGA